MIVRQGKPVLFLVMLCTGLADIKPVAVAQFAVPLEQPGRLVLAGLEL